MYGTCPGCSQGVWNSACWQVSLTFLYLGRLLVCCVFGESSFFLKIFLHNNRKWEETTINKLLLSESRHCKTIKVLLKVFLMASRDHNKWVRKLCGVYVSEGRGMELHSASHQCSAPGQAVWPQLGIMFGCSAPSHPPPPQGLAESPPRPCQLLSAALSPALCQHCLAANNPQTEWRRQQSTEQPVPSRVEPLSCFILSSTPFQGKTANVHTLSWR